MIFLSGKYNEAKVYTDILENEAISQITELCNEEFAKESKIRIMPDVHAGKGCTIGTTMTIKNKVVVNLVGVDIGCGMLTVKLKNKEIDLKKLDEIINNYVPSGQDIRKTNHDFNKYIDLEKLKCIKHVDLERALKSLGTLGGGNHFIELNKSSSGDLYLVIHSGSRYLGKQVAEYYQKKAIEYHKDNSKEKQLLISKLKAEGRTKDIEKELKNMKRIRLKDEFCYLEGENFSDYIHDMNIVQQYAKLNREAIANTILNKVNLNMINSFTTIHNYIEIKEDKEYILRKGAVRANKDELILIPINMRDGSILAVGKGNEEWNFSAPHGAGRLMSRSKAKNSINLEDFKKTMKGIYSTSVGESTLDESPMAYKPIESIIENIKDTADIIDILKPIYNYKAH